MQGAVIEHRSGYLSADCEGRDARELAELYRALAVECMATHTNRVLVKAADCDAEGHRALRDALTTMILAGMAGGLRLAVLTAAPRVRGFFAELQSDVQPLSIHVALFTDETEAVDWLLKRGAPHADAQQGRARQQA